MTYKITQQHDVWQKVGKKDVLLQEYDYGMVMSDFCLLYKKDAKLHKKTIMTFLKIAMGESQVKKTKPKAGVSVQ